MAVIDRFQVVLCAVRGCKRYRAQAATSNCYQSNRYHTTQSNRDRFTCSMIPKRDPNPHAEVAGPKLGGVCRMQCAPSWHACHCVILALQPPLAPPLNGPDHFAEWHAAGCRSPGRYGNDLEGPQNGYDSRQGPVQSRAPPRAAHCPLPDALAACPSWCIMRAVEAYLTADLEALQQSEGGLLPQEQEVPTLASCAIGSLFFCCRSFQQPAPPAGPAGAT
jgi:hypothetical protein